MEFTKITVHLPLDVVVPVAPDTPVSSLSGLLAEGSSKQLYQMRQSIVDYVQGTTFHTPRVYHFKPKQLNHFVTVVYPDGVEEKKLGLYLWS